MKKSLIILLVIFLCSCASRQLTPEMEYISSVSDTSKCKFIRNMYCETQPHTMIHYVKLNTGNAGGDSYKIISTNNQIISGINVMMINFEVYKCR